MTRLDRYIAGEILRYFLMILLVISVIFVVVDYLSNADKFFAAGLSLPRAVTYIALRLPREIAQLLPLCFFLSVLAVLGLVNRSNELIALKGGGIGPWVLLRPVLIGSVGMSLLGLFMADTVAPMAASEVNAIRFNELSPASIKVKRKENIRIRQDDFFISIRQVDLDRGQLQGVRIHEVTEAVFLPKRRILAERGFFTADGWLLEKVLVQEMNPETGSFTSQSYASLHVPVALTIEDFERIRKAAEEMGIRFLWDYIHKIQKEGYDVTGYRVDFFGKTAFPFASLALCFLAVFISLRPAMKNNMAIGMGYGIGIAFLYWVCYSFSLSLGHGGVLPAVFAAWMPNLLFGALGVYALLGLD
ncbi:LPS export ABC transporter permease LptG [Desulfobotulus sp. H1]|uniref:LPS export ABC transporter permease LptG n=1 Tax=Desulfobotulus pelophilus TaxID=2823377 RepID=A0ABT3N9F1_9BACT|nr:LPS export ABC transporter permease LptG [Desulfobotulus pelophilus]MCW7754092.1 LPS export ABC transporter permease LptG [Desulfobotulus pelophilus]